MEVDFKTATDKLNNRFHQEEIERGEKLSALREEANDAIEVMRERLAEEHHDIMAVTEDAINWEKSQQALELQILDAEERLELFCVDSQLQLSDG